MDKNIQIQNFNQVIMKLDLEGTLSFLQLSEN